MFIYFWLGFFFVYNLEYIENIMNIDVKKDSWNFSLVRLIDDGDCEIG